MKLIISSATLDEEKFATYFNNAPILVIDSEVHHVEIGYVLDTVEDYVLEAAEISIMINESEEEGDIIVFLTGSYYFYSVSEFKNCKVLLCVLKKGIFCDIILFILLLL